MVIACNHLSEGYNALDVAMQLQRTVLLSELMASSESLAPWGVIKAIKEYVQHREYHSDILPLLLAHSNIAELILRHRHISSPVAWATEYQCAQAVECARVMRCPE